MSNKYSEHLKLLVEYEKAWHRLEWEYDHVPRWPIYHSFMQMRILGKMHKLTKQYTNAVKRSFK